MGYENKVTQEWTKSLKSESPELNNEEKNLFNLFQNAISNEKILQLINDWELELTDQLTPKQKNNLYLGAVLVIEKSSLTNTETVALADKIIEQLAPGAEEAVA